MSISFLTLFCLVLEYYCRVHCSLASLGKAGLAALLYVTFAAFYLDNGCSCRWDQRCVVILASLLSCLFLLYAATNSVGQFGQMAEGADLLKNYLLAKVT